MYNESIFNQTTLWGFASGINTESGYLLGGLLLVVAFVVLFVVNKLYETNAAFLVSSFITTLLAIFMGFGMKWIPVDWVLIPAVLTMFAVILNAAEK
jgi:hypothetical protein